MYASSIKTSPVPEYHYPGEELTLFAIASTWKRYLAQQFNPYISGRVLEVGAGAGETTAFFSRAQVSTWTCLEPDPSLLRQIQQKIANRQLPSSTLALSGTINDLPAGEKFDTILYIDVLEHIEHDHQELQQAVAHLEKGGHLMVLSPAYQVLYSPFDKAIGHYRRYRKKTLRQAAHLPGLQEKKMYYIESVGAVLLLLNRFIVRKKYPAAREVALWQRFLVPVSKVLDKVLFYSMGKTIIGIWEHRKTSA